MWKGPMRHFSFGIDVCIKLTLILQLTAVDFYGAQVLIKLPIRTNIHRCSVISNHRKGVLKIMLTLQMYNLRVDIKFIHYSNIFIDLNFTLP
jgi:hypothetical protein